MTDADGSDWPPIKSSGVPPRTGPPPEKIPVKGWNPYRDRDEEVALDAEMLAREDEHYEGLTPIPEDVLQARDAADERRRTTTLTIDLVAQEPGQIEALLEAFTAVLGASPVQGTVHEPEGYTMAFGAGDDLGWAEHRRG